MQTGSLNWFRALAALWVLLAHCAIWTGSSLFLNPKIAVDLFMVLSGFLMMHTTQKSSDVVAFYTRRFFRIAPLYYVALFAAAVSAPYFLGGYSRLLSFLSEARGLDPSLVVFDPANILMHLSFLFGLHPEYSQSSMMPDWSLALEVQFYVLFPAILMATRRFGVIGPALVLWATSRVLVKGYSLLVASDLIEPFREPSLLIFKLPIFLIGVLLFEAARTERPAIRYAALLLAAAIAIYEQRLYGNDGWILPVLVALMALLLLSPATPMAALFDNRVTRFMSDVSYSVYLVHGFVLSLGGSFIAERAVQNGYSQPAVFLLVAVFVAPVTYAISYLTYRFIEQPGIRFGKSLIGFRYRELSRRSRYIEP